MRYADIDGKVYCKPNPKKYAGKLKEVAAESREAAKAYTDDEGGSALVGLFGQRIKRRGGRRGSKKSKRSHRKRHSKRGSKRSKKSKK